MKPRIRPLSNLYHRWGHRAKLDATQVAEALERAGLIERIGLDKYRETPGPKVALEEYERTVSTILSLYKELNHGRP